MDPLLKDQWRTTAAAALVLSYCTCEHWWGWREYDTPLSVCLLMGCLIVERESREEEGEVCARSMWRWLGWVQLIWGVD